MSPESARRVRYQKANREAGLCALCPNWSDGKFYCWRHEELRRRRYHARAATHIERTEKR